MKLKQYKGIDIEVDSGGDFSAKIGDLQIEHASLRDVEKEIEKELKEKVTRSKKKPVGLPVVALATKQGGRYGEGVTLGLRAGIITGINRTTREITVEFTDPEADGYTNGTLLADTPANRVLVEEYARLIALRDVMDERKIALRGYGRIGAEEYDGVLDKVRKLHAASAKES